MNQNLNAIHNKVDKLFYMLGISAYIGMVYSDGKNDIQLSKMGWIGEEQPNSILPLEVATRIYHLLRGYEIALLPNCPDTRKLSSLTINVAKKIAACASTDQGILFLTTYLLLKSMDDFDALHLNQIVFYHPDEQQKYLIDLWKGTFSKRIKGKKITLIPGSFVELSHQNNEGADVRIDFCLRDRNFFLMEELNILMKSNHLPRMKGTNLSKGKFVFQLNGKCYHITFTDGRI